MLICQDLVASLRFLPFILRPTPQVYNRALNEAEIQALMASGPTP
jgi:hypothetical protein